MPPLDGDTITHVRASWEEIAANAPRLGTLFYDHLFSADPALVSLFSSNARGEMEEQSDKLMQMLGVAIEEATNPDVFVPMLQRLGRRHAGYGVRPEYYPLVGAALMKTLAEGLGDRFTPPVARAWATVYEAMADVMLSAARAEPRSA